MRGADEAKVVYKQMSPAGFERPLDSSAEIESKRRGAAFSGAFPGERFSDDPIIAEVASSWPALSPSARAEVLAVVRADLAREHRQRE